MATQLRCVRDKMTKLWLQNVFVNAPDAFTVRVEFDKFNIRVFTVSHIQDSETPTL